MRVLCLTLLLLPGSGLVAQDTCVDCHTTLQGTPQGEPLKEFDRDVHRQIGLSCASCHGGDPTASTKELAKDPAKGYLGAPSFDEIPQFCGRCHSSPDFMRRFNPAARVDQVAGYLTSVHGQRLAQGDTRVATCTSCHSVHGVLRAGDPNSPVHPQRVAGTCGACHSDAERMQPFGIPTNQEEEYRASVHGLAISEKRDLSAATCNDCHGSHGAAAPGVDSAATACGTCHVLQRNLFTKSPHGEVFEVMGMSDCVTCHGNHAVKAADESLLAGAGSACSKCHESDSGTETADKIAAGILDLRRRIESARGILEEAERAGMEVSLPIYNLLGAEEQVHRARSEIHLLDVDKIEASIAEGVRIADASHQEGIGAFDELGFRKRGLYLALLIIVSVVISLALWIRQIESKPIQEE